jgi:hypothetical protein
MSPNEGQTLQTCAGGWPPAGSRAGSSGRQNIEQLIEGYTRLGQAYPGALVSLVDIPKVMKALRKQHDGSGQSGRFPRHHP